MKKAMLMIVLMIFAVFFLLLLTSCISNSPSKSEPNVLLSSRKSFLQIRTFALIKICKKDSCEENSKHLSSGSGFVVAIDKNGSYILTAAHVCENVGYESFKISVEEKNKKFSASIKFFGRTVNYDRHELHVVKADRDLDLCIMYSPGLKSIPIPIARRTILPGAKIYNIAAPLDIMHKNAPVMVDGFYSGRDPESGADVFTMIVDNGSSGSPIMNDRGEVIGIVSMKNIHFEFLAYSPPLELIRYFVFNVLHAYSPEPIIGFQR
jgi:S1-C subfamily serine protease